MNGRERKKKLDKEKKTMNKEKKKKRNDLGKRKKRGKRLNVDYLSFFHVNAYLNGFNVIVC